MKTSVVSFIPFTYSYDKFRFEAVENNKEGNTKATLEMCNKVWAGNARIGWRKLSEDIRMLV